MLEKIFHFFNQQFIGGRFWGPNVKKSFFGLLILTVNRLKPTLSGYSLTFSWHCQMRN